MASTGETQEHGDTGRGPENFDPIENLLGDDPDETMQTGYSPPDREPQSLRNRPTIAQQRRGLSTDEYLAQEEPDVDPTAAVAALFAKEGADVAICYLAEMEDADAEQTCALVRDAGRKAVAFRSDLADAAACRQLVSDAADPSNLEQGSSGKIRRQRPVQPGRRTR